MNTSVAGLQFVAPDPDRDAPFALAWFQSDDGKETLLLMGNAEHEIDVPTLEGEMNTLREFIQLKEENKQLTWMLRIDDKTIGAAWIELTENHGVKPPSVHIMIGDKSYRGRGIGRATMSAMIDYIKDNLDVDTIYSRHLASNEAIARLNDSLGFVKDGAPYIDENNLEWQNIKLPV